MSGTSQISKRVSIRLPNDVVQTLRCRIDGRRTHWQSIGEYLKDRIIYDVRRPHGEKHQKGEDRK